MCDPFSPLPRSLFLPELSTFSLPHPSPSFLHHHRLLLAHTRTESNLVSGVCAPTHLGYTGL